MTKVLEVTSITKKIGNKTIIDDATFAVEKGQVVGLLGPNGAGKTTLIRMIVGLMKHNEGEIMILGHSLTGDFKNAVAEVGAIIENPEFYNYMSGYDNLEQYVRMSRKPITREQLVQVVQQVHLENNIKQKVKTYSLGMRQRLGVAQALVHRPRLLVLDEPMNGLDPKGMKEFRDLILSLRDQGISVLVSSHQLSDIEQLADHLVIVQKGRITHQVSMAELHGAGKAVVVETNDNQTALTILNEQGFDNIQVTDGQLLIPMEIDRRGEIAKAIVAAGLELKELHLKQSTLEETFLAWTEEGGL